MILEFTSTFIDSYQKELVDRYDNIISGLKGIREDILKNVYLTLRYENQIEDLICGAERVRLDLMTMEYSYDALSAIDVISRKRLEEIIPDLSRTIKSFNKDFNIF